MKENQVNSEGSELRRDQLPREGKKLKFSSGLFCPGQVIPTSATIKNRQMSIKVAQT